MYHSVRFARNGEVKNSWDDWYLVPSSRPVINPPTPKTTNIDIPGANGTIDLSTVVSGDIVYQNRQGTIDFIVMNEKPMEWFELYSTIMDYLHGQVVQVSLEDEIPENGTVPEYYYEGRCTVDAWKSEDYYSTISIGYDLYPYKYKTEATSETVNLSSTTATTKTFILDGRMPLIPKFTVSNVSGSEGVHAQVKFNSDTWYDLSSGENAVANIVFTKGNNVVQLRMSAAGSASVTVSYREGRL